MFLFLYVEEYHHRRLPQFLLPYKNKIYSRAAIIQTCAAQIYARSPFSNSDMPEKLENFKVELISKKVL